MTTYQARILAHLIWMAQSDKAYAWQAAKNFATLDPYQLADMPALLTQAMRAQQSQKS